MIKGGTTVLYVSHSLESIKELCTKVIWIEHGQIIKMGDTKEICDEYILNLLIKRGYFEGKNFRQREWADKYYRDLIVISYNEIDCINQLYNKLRGKVSRINIIVTDIDKSNKKVWGEYKSVLDELQLKVSEELQENNHTQINILSDRLYLAGMNNCNAGYESMTLMPNGRFYPCPGFYYDNPDENFGNIEQGVCVRNQQLYKLDHAPICSHCDAYQCRRCVWLNRKTTLEVNTASKEQCVWSHIERNASAKILSSIRKNMGEMVLQNISIPEIKYLDPFDNRDEWI